MSELLIPVDCLQVGVFIRIGLKWYEHPFLSSSFKIKNEQQIQTLRDLGLRQVEYIPEKSDRQPLAHPPARNVKHTLAKPVIPSENSEKWPEKPRATGKETKERIELLREHKHRIHQCEKQYQKTFSQVKTVMQNMVTGSQEAAEEADLLIKGMVQSLLAQSEIVVHLMNVKGKDEGVFYHTLNVAILAMLLGREAGIGPGALRLLGLGALFHDIGKHRIPKKILYKQTPLTSSERDLLRLHTQYGNEIASRIEAFPEEAIEIIRQHHELMDGTGFPDALAGEQISKLSRIVSIANVYDNFCNRHNPDDSMTPHEALSCMFSRNQKQFDRSLLSLFIRFLGVYPPGAIIELSNGRIGMVVTVRANSRLRPLVIVYDADIPKQEALAIDLQEHPEITIMRSIRPSQLPSEIYAYLDPRIRVAYYMDLPEQSPLKS